MRPTTLALLLAASTAALLLAGCSAPEATPDPADGSVEGDGAGSLTGYVNVQPNESSSDEGEAPAGNETTTDGE